MSDAVESARNTNGGISSVWGTATATSLFGLLAVACLALSLTVTTTLVHFALFGMAVGLTAVAGLAILARRDPAAAVADGTAALFDDMCKGAVIEMLLTRANGQIQRHYRPDAAPDAVASPNTGTEVAVALDRQFRGAAAIVYRLLRGVAAEGLSAEEVNDRKGNTFQIEARRLGDDAVLWSIGPAVRSREDEILTDMLAAAPTVVTDRRGRVISISDAARKLVAGFGQDADAVLREWETTGSSHLILPDPDADIAGLRAVQMHGTGRDGVWVLREIHEDDLAAALPEDFMNALPVALARIATNGEIIYVNGAARALLGRQAKPGQNISDLMEGLGRPIPERINDMLQGRKHMPSEMSRARIAGKEKYLSMTLKRLRVGDDLSLIAVISDATELKTLEAQFVQTQKMQAVGQLAGGVAHDFNNLLTAINGHCELMLMRHQKNDPDYGDLIQIRQNSMRAAAVVNKLLAYSRKQTLMPKVISLYDTLTDLHHLLNRLLGEKVTLKIENATDLPPIRVDERQLEQVIMNLVVNARDAMPEGGEVAIRTEEVELTENLERDNAIVPFGRYVRIAVSDTGTGMDPETVKKVFEPFFTTKGVGKGTGLGLSTAYGIIKQTGGFIFVDSTLGEGTVFTLYLPVYEDMGHDAPAATEAPSDTAPRDQRDLTGRGVVLLVEDELPVRMFAAKALAARGYSVLEAASAEEALELLADPDLEVDMFVSDVVMPGADGPTWVKEAQKTRPDTRVVFMSGYSEHSFEEGELEVRNATFLAKPFTLQELTQTVKDRMEA